MPKKNQNNKNNILTVCESFNQALSASCSTSTYVYAITPATFSTRINALADAFQEYKVTKLSYRFHPIETPVASSITASYSPGVVDTPPSTLATSFDGTSPLYYSGRQIAPSAWSHVPKAVLSGSRPWYKTQPSTMETADEQQGQINLVATGSATCGFILETHVVIHFRGPNATANTPMLKAVQKAKLHDAILDAMTSPSLSEVKKQFASLNDTSPQVRRDVNLTSGLPKPG